MKQTNEQKKEFFIELLNDLLDCNNWTDWTRVKASAYFCAMCYACDIEVDTHECDIIISKLYNEHAMEKEIAFADFVNHLCCELY